MVDAPVSKTGGGDSVPVRFRPSAPTLMTLYFRILRYIKPYIPSFIFSIVLVLLFTAANVFFLPLTRDIVNELADKNLLHINNQIINAILLYGIRLATQQGQMYVMTSISCRITIDIRMELYRKLQKLPQSFYAEWKLGDLLSRLFSDVDKMKEAIIQSFAETLPQMLTFLGIIGYLFIMNWKLTLFTLVTIPMFVGIIGFAAGKLKINARNIQRKAADITHIAQETLSNVKSVQANTMEEYEIDRFKRENMRSYHTTMIGVGVKAKVEPFISFLQFMVIGLVVWYGGYEMTLGHMSGANLASFFTGIMLLIDPVLALSKVYTNLQQAMASTERVFEVMDLPIEIQTEAMSISPERIKGTVEFKHVTFEYEGAGGAVIRDFNLKVLEGEVIALVGLSGAGKSTLVSLIPRFYDPTEGTICIDDIDIKTMNLHTLRSHMGIVPQEDVLFRGSILDNVRYGKPDATKEEVITALKMANAWEFVEPLSRQLRSVVGDRGRKLSGGQKQRLSIARAILRNPRILILDEATSALDSKSEQLVQDALVALMKNRTTFVIAHRLSTIRHAHKIVVLDKGKIVEMGSHDELIEKNGNYAHLVVLQTQQRH